MLSERSTPLYKSSMLILVIVAFLVVLISVPNSVDVVAVNVSF